jgi:hypothetical protein
MTWLAPIQDVRDQLSDNDKSKLRYRKKIIGQVDGTNTVFKTLEFRRITDFTTAVAPMGVYVANTLQVVTSDFPEIGEFTLSVAPTDGQDVSATYYTQWFLDAEIIDFLSKASTWLGFDENYDNTPPGLQPAAKFYACKQACENLALRWADYLTETYQFSDAPRSDEKNPVESYQKLAESYMKQAQEARKGYYTRQDQAEAPLFANIGGCVIDVPPKR